MQEREMHAREIPADRLFARCRMESGYWQALPRWVSDVRDSNGLASIPMFDNSRIGSRALFTNIRTLSEIVLPTALWATGRNKRIGPTVLLCHRDRRRGCCTIHRDK